MGVEPTLAEDNGRKAPIVAWEAEHQRRGVYRPWGRLWRRKTGGPACWLRRAHWNIFPSGPGVPPRNGSDRSPSERGTARIGLQGVSTLEGRGVEYKT